MNYNILSERPYIVQVFGSIDSVTYRLRNRAAFQRFLEILGDVTACENDDYCLVLLGEILDRERVPYQIVDDTLIDRDVAVCM